jgi:UDP-MurNAc hydroxylase
MRLTWVNHAAFVLESRDIRLICDPWIEGTAFNNGWRLMSPTKMRYEDFASITHVWFSHEHPDHFSPPNLKNIPEQVRNRITVLFHETRDKRVAKTCQSLGFTVRELPDRTPISIGEDFKVTCGLNDLIDSWIAISAEGKTVLNLNDCIFPKRGELGGIRALVGTVDLLLSQFSYAHWVGNPGDLTAHRAQAMKKRGEMSAQIELIRPRQFIPFASYVYFCHEENFHLNQAGNRVGDICAFAEKNLGQETVVLYPEERWQVGKPHDSREAIERYEADLERALSSTPLKSRTVDFGDLQRAMSELIDQCRKRNSSLVLSALPAGIVRLADLRQDVEISYRRGIQPVLDKQPDIVLSSDSMLYCIKTDWGGDTLKINGRFEVPVNGKPARFFKLFRIPQYNSYGENVNVRFVAGRVFDAIRHHASN